MPSIILSINAGSSSVKTSVFKAPEESSPDPLTPILLAEATISGLTAPPPTLTYTRGTQKVAKGDQLSDISSQESAFRYILSHMTHDAELPELTHLEDIKYTCHRVVHGGDYPRSQIITSETYHHIETLSDLAPLHNAPALDIIHSVTQILSGATNIAYFDSSFHSTIPRHIYTYPINPVIATTNKLRKYGFHGLSYSFILRSVSSHLHKSASETNIIALHLGSGASIACIKNGRSLDTSMQLTPLSGLPGATRSGSIDPSLIFHFTHEAGMPSRESSTHLHITQAEEILNKESGWKALTGTTDFGVISVNAVTDSGIETSDETSDEKRNQNQNRDPDGKYTLAFNILVDRILNFLPAYFVKLDGRVDALVFAGGIGEKGSKLRKAVVDGCQCLGFAVHEERNERPGEETVADISANGAKYKTLIVKTDEQLEMARGVLEDRKMWVAKE